MKSLRNSKGLYWGLIITFFVLYFCVGFVSTLHSITFFELANVTWMAVLLGITYEVGQASVLFSILMSDNAKRMLPWLLMILLTALQVTANVYASFKFMDGSGSNDWTFWQRSILFWLEADGPEMFKVIISWITGALLPIVALGMTALVAENLKLKDEQDREKEGDDGGGRTPTPEERQEIAEQIEDLMDHLEGESDERKMEMPEEIDPKLFGGGPTPGNPEAILDPVTPTEETLEIKPVDPLKAAIAESIRNVPEETPAVIKERMDKKRRDLLAEDLLKNKGPATKEEQEAFRFPGGIVEGLETQRTLDEPLEAGVRPVEPHENLVDLMEETLKPIDPNVGVDPEELKNNPKGKKISKRPSNASRGWHLKKEHVDVNGDVYHYGVHSPNEKRTPPEEESKKA